MYANKTRSAAAAAEFRAEMGRQQMSIQELAAHVDLHPNTVSLKLRGQRSLSLDEFFLMADALRLDRAKLVSTVADCFGSAE
ncbi:MAG: helix-turn-helix domain-containing protein [Propionibacteriaceae bacterium]|jgi:transcriptional regulator with XRE-family HTH domain|nr:helix-turn-helix domain-containing protein [Propionibacteriaceae bacterium]